MDRGPWQATVHAVTNESDTERLKQNKQMQDSDERQKRNLVYLITYYLLA